MSSGFVFRIQSQPSSDVSQTVWAVPSQGGTVGRSPNCSWFINDPDRVLSRQHARVDIVQQQCLWTDLGTNSTQVNGKPMPQGQAVRLHVGDVLKISNYCMVLEQAAADWQGVNQLMPISENDPLASLIPVAEIPLNIDDLLADIEVPSQTDEHAASEYVPVLAQRMYVGESPRPRHALLQSSEELKACQAQLATLNHLLRSSVQGYMQLLAARRIVKIELGGDLTTLSAKANNPLKLCVSLDDVMQRLLSPPAPGYLDAQQAIEQAHQDVLEHMQLGVHRIQSLIREIQTALDPQVIQQEADQTQRLAFASSTSRKARLWDLYCERYQQLGSTWN